MALTRPGEFLFLIVMKALIEYEFSKNGVFKVFHIRMKESYLEGCRLLLEQIRSPHVVHEKTIRLNPVFTPGLTMKKMQPKERKTR